MRLTKLLALACAALAACGTPSTQNEKTPQPGGGVTIAPPPASGQIKSAAATNLLTNGDFEAGSFTGWTKVSYNFVVTSPIHSGTYSAQVGSMYGTYSADMNISQSVAIPASGATLSFYWYPVCNDTITYDWQTVEVRSTSGATLATLFKVCDNSQVWKNVTYDLSKWAGQTVKLWFNDHDDGYSSTDATYYYLDDVSVTANGTVASDFSVAVAPSTQSVAAGSSVSYTVSTAVTAGSAQTVNLAVSGLPAGVTGSLSSTAVTAGNAATLTLTAASSAAATSATFTVTGTATSGSHAATAGVTVTAAAANDFSVSLSPASQSLAQGASAAYTVSTAVTSGSSQTVNLSVTGLPSGVTGSFAATSLTAGSSTTLTLTASGTATTGSATFTVTGSGTSASHAATAQVSVTAASSGVGPNGGTVDHLFFAVVGDTRPGTLDDTANYPTAIITKVYSDMQAMSPRPQFVVGTGDYMFASTTGSQAQPQMNLYTQAKANYTGTVFAAMGNHECDGYTADNCTANQTSNLNVFNSALVTPLGKSTPYYTINIGSTTGAWTAKLIVIACNQWDATQKSWLTGELAKPTTYTILARHEPKASSTGPCVSNVESLMTQYPYNLSLVGHTHTFSGSASSKEVIVGTGGAPISSSSVPYGYATVERISSGWQIKQYDYSTAAAVNTFVIP
jgi:Calcineurin-like phosphoesterase